MNPAKLAASVSITLLCLTFHARTAHAADCGQLAELHLPNTTITLAEPVAAGSFKAPSAGMGPPAAYDKLPAFCRVAGTIKPTADSDIRFEVWMPASGWNGKFVGVGNGVWAGAIPYSRWCIRSSAATQRRRPTMVTRAIRSTPVSQWGIPEKLIDFGHRAPHEMTVAAKATIAAFYEKAPTRSLFVSCSTGGRQGLMEAHRYPDRL